MVTARKATEVSAHDVSNVKIAIIGGSGIGDSLEGLGEFKRFDTQYVELRVEEVWKRIGVELNGCCRTSGVHNSKVRTTLIAGNQQVSGLVEFKIEHDDLLPGVIEYKEKDGVIFIPRHGHSVRYGPSCSQYAANLIAAKALGANVVIATSAVGSLRSQTIKLEDLVVPHDYVDESGRNDNIWGVGLVIHFNPRPAFSEGLRKILIECAKEGAYFNNVHEHGVYVTIPGDRFSSSAEGMKRSTYADIIGMTANPEAQFAMQLGLEYAVAAFPVDYDSDANHEQGTLEIMRRLSEPHRVPVYLSNVIQRTKDYVAEWYTRGTKSIDQLNGGLIPCNLGLIQNSHLRKIAEELVRTYCR
ncbi:hypothetical protein HY636_00350 [Candidatus Woesearchaeota archaeon]|nr:hypothetical protein [Candidatus Woesearchaeota archaeon]